MMSEAQKREDVFYCNVSSQIVEIALCDVSNCDDVVGTIPVTLRGFHY